MWETWSASAVAAVGEQRRQQVVLDVETEQEKEQEMEQEMEQEIEQEMEQEIEQVSVVKVAAVGKNNPLLY